MRPVLLIDEAQEMPQGVLSELRLLSSMQFDSRVFSFASLRADSSRSSLMHGIASVVFLVAALLSKEKGIILPVLVFAMNWCP